MLYHYRACLCAPQYRRLASRSVVNRASTTPPFLRNDGQRGLRTSLVYVRHNHTKSTKPSLGDSGDTVSASSLQASLRFLLGRFDAVPSPRLSSDADTRGALGVDAACSNVEQPRTVPHPLPRLQETSTPGDFDSLRLFNLVEKEELADTSELVWLSKKIRELQHPAKPFSARKWIQDFRAVIEPSKRHYDSSSRTSTAFVGLAAHAAAMGYDEGVVALMDHHLERREPDSVLQIAFAARNAMDLRFTKLQNLRANAAGSLVIRDLGPTPREVTTQTWTHAIVACAMKKALHPLLKIGAVPIGPSHAKFIAPSFDAPFMQYLSSVASRYHLGAPDSFLLNLPQRLKNLEQVAIPAPAFRRFVTRLERLPIRRHLLTIAQIVKTELLQADPLLIVDGADSVKARTHLRFVFTVDHWASLTIALARLGDENALETFCTSMHEIAGETPSLVKAALIEGYTSSHRFDKARAAAQTSISKSTPEAAVYRAHIEALLAEASYKDTLKALNLFAAHHTCINQDPEASYEGALKALDLFAAHHTCINQDPEAVSVFNTVLDWLARQSRLDEAYALLSRMQERELRPDIASFNAILRHSHDSHTIQDVLHRMDKLGVAADAETAAILLVAHLSAGADALDLVRRALNKTGTEVRSALAVDDDAQDAKWWTWWEVTSGADRKTLKAAMRAQRKRHNHRSSICNEILGRLLARDDDAGFNAAYILLTHMWANRHIVHPTLRSSSLLTPDMNCKKWRNAKELRKEVQTRRVPSHLQSLVDALELQHTDMPSCREVD